MKKLTLNILLLILFFIAAVVNVSWVCVSTDNGISYLEVDPNEPGPEFIGDSIGYLVEDPNEPGPEFIGGSIGYVIEDPNEPGPECI
jgi:hypothetical protein